MSEFKNISTKNLTKSIERLTTLADYLRDNVKKSHFELETFIHHPDAHDDYRIGSNDENDLKQIRKELKEGFCGTTACAIGHACMIPEFQRKGLKVRIEKPLDGWVSHNAHELKCSYKDKHGTITTDFEAAEKFFKLSPARVEQLFSPDGYPGNNWDDVPVPKSKVIKAIRGYVYRAKKHLAERTQS